MKKILMSILLLVLACDVNALNLKPQKNLFELGLGVGGISFESSFYPQKDRLGVISYDTIVPMATFQINFNSDFSLEMSLFGSTTQEMQSYGGGFESETLKYGEVIRQTVTFSGKFFPLDFFDYGTIMPNTLPYVGFGVAYTRQLNTVGYEVNGVKYKTVGDGLSPVFQVGADVPLVDNWVKMNFDLKRTLISTLTMVGGGRDINTYNNWIFSSSINFLFL